MVIQEFLTEMLPVHSQEVAQGKPPAILETRPLRRRTVGGIGIGQPAPVRYLRNETLNRVPEPTVTQNVFSGAYMRSGP